MIWMPWTLTDGPPWHVMPLFDLRDHEPETACWCRPTPDADEPQVLRHHALDDRESYGQGRALQ